MGSKDARCPVCNSEEYDGFECYECMFLACPICDKPVNDFGEVGEVNPCEHVVAWGTIGESEIIWVYSEHEQQYDDLCEEHDNYDIETYADKKGLEYVEHSDEAGHGHSRGAFFIFDHSIPRKN